MMAKYDYLVVGAGLFGATFAYRARRMGKKVLVVEKRPHTGGNVYCETVAGITVHRYGAHIFHTSDKEVWDFVTSLVPFNRFTNSPLAVSGGRVYNLPFNMNTFRQVWGVRTPSEAAEILELQRAEAAASLAAEGLAAPRNLEQQALLLVGKDIYELLVKGYTEKQWGRPCDQLPPEIIKRLPVRLTYDNNYFNDLYQGIPAGGYNRLVDALLQGVETVTGTDFLQDRERLGQMAGKILYTGPLDAFYDYRYGKLGYRTLRFDTQVLPVPNYQGNAVINYTDHSVPWTRILEHKHFECFGDRVYDRDETVITKEFSIEWKEGMEPFYPVNDEANEALFARYRELASVEKDVIFGGRLAEYRYYDMAPTISRALHLPID